MALANLDYALTEDIDFHDEWIESEHPRVPEGAPGGGQFTSGGAGGGVSGGGAPLLLPAPVGLHSDYAKQAHKMAVGGAHIQEIEEYADQLIAEGSIGKYSKTAVYLENLVTAMTQQAEEYADQLLAKGSAAPSKTEIPHNTGMINASEYAKAAYELAMMPGNTSGDIQKYLELDLASGAVGKNSPAAQYIEEIIKAKKAQEAAHGAKTSEKVDIQAEPPQKTSFAPELTPKQQGEYAAGTATTELEAAAADPAKLAKFGEQSHAIGQALNTPEALAGEAVQDAKISISTWTTPGANGFHMITNHLMGKATSEKAAYHADMLQKAILSNSIPESVNAYRGVKGDMFQEIQTKQPGDAWTIKKFQATTIDPRKATYYAKGGKGGAMIHYVLPKGQKALYVSDPKLNDWEDEHELLLPAGSTIKLVGTSSVELPEYDYTGKQVGPGGPVKIYHVEVMQPGSPEFEAAHPRGEGGKFVAKPGTEALAEQEKFDGGAFDPDPDSEMEPIPEPWSHLPPNTATAHAQAIYSGFVSGEITSAAEVQDEIDTATQHGLILEHSSQHDYLQDLHAAVAANEAKAAPTAPDPAKIPDLPFGASFVAKTVWNGAKSGKTHADLSTWAETQINNGNMLENGTQHEYVKQVLAAVKAQEGGAAPAPAAKSAPTSAEPVAYPAPFKPIEMPKPDLPNAPSAEHAYEQVTGRSGEGAAWLKEYIEKSTTKNTQDPIQEGVVAVGSDEHKYLQKLLRTLQQQKYAAQNAAQQPELFAESATPAPAPSKPTTLGYAESADYGRGGKPPKVKAVHETKHAHSLALGNKLRMSAAKPDSADSYEARNACPSLNSEFWRRQPSEVQSATTAFQSSSQGINGVLLGVDTSPDDEVQEQIDGLDAAFDDDDCVTEQDVRVFRGTSWKPEVLQAMKDKLASGNQVVEARKGYTSTSLADKISSGFEGSTYLNITVRKGTRALGLFGKHGPNGSYAGENELTLRHNGEIVYYAIHEHDNRSHTVFGYTR